MDLTNEDVSDILALLDSLPYDELDLQTPRFRLTLRRTPDGWTQAVEARAAPTVVDVVPAAAPAGGKAAGPAGGKAAGPAGGKAGGTAAGTAAGTGGTAGAEPAAATAAGGEATTSLSQRGRQNDVVATTTRLGAEPPAPEAAAAMEHRCRSGGSDVPSVSSGDGLVAVRAPLPGTFYRAPRPGAAPFVEVGSRVGADTVVGIVETMKLFNSVTAGAAGTVAEICLGNAEFADRGATLLRIRAD
jgi:acetyl-CoA carboxylase biotin carboxyl carrier protein